MRLGLFGGSFDPPHIGHLRAAKIFAQSAKLDMLYIMPAYVSPFKTQSQNNITATQRLEMTQRAFSLLSTPETKIVISDIEVANTQTSYTIDTVNKILDQHDENRLFLLVGSDMFVTLERWKSFEELFKRCDIYTMTRKNQHSDILYAYAENYRKTYGACVNIIECDALQVSSTEIREKLRYKDYSNLQNLLTGDVLRYIIDNSLYQDAALSCDKVFCHTPTSDETISAIQKDMQKFLTPDRLNHTLSVEGEAQKIANLFFPSLGIDLKYLTDISAAALLHDFTKKLDIISQKELCVKYGVKTDSVSCDSCSLLHSVTAAHFARDRYKINNIVFNAVKNHTTGNKNMNIIDKIIFLSDYIEPTRKNQSCINARNVFYHDIETFGPTQKILDKAVLNSLESTIKHLLDTHQPIDIETVRARNCISLF